MLLVLLAVHTGLIGLTAINLIHLYRRRGHRVVPPSWPRVSVLVPARNEEENLKRLLPSLLGQDYADFQVIVVDDASEDGTAAVLAASADPRLTVISGDGPPPGWLGKPHACYQAARHADGSVFLFLDADAELSAPDGLRQLVEGFVACGENAVMTGLPRYTGTGGGLLLTSLVPFAILSALPLPLVPRTRTASLSALNGQVWMIGADAYRHHRPHEAQADAILEDVQIGRLLKRRGMTLHLLDLADEVRVEMYRSFGEAWRGFRKNAYLLQGGRPSVFLPLHLVFWTVFVLAPLAGWPLLVTLYVMKGLSDRGARLPFWVTVLAPFVTLCGALIQLDSAIAHWTDRVAWKGRRV